MSLFGGALPERGDDNDDNNNNQSSSPQPSSPPPQPFEAQPPPRQSIEHDIADDEHEPSASDYGSEEEHRPNAFDGLPGTWRRYTLKERDLEFSLGQLRAADLSCHLYNAHALNRRLRSHGAAEAAKQWETKTRWIDEAQREEWAPPTTWTAWPLEPDQVPRAHETFADAPVIDSEHNSTVREQAYSKQKPSQDLEDIFVGVVQKKAKERWDQRPSESESAGEDERQHPEARGARLDTDARARKSSANGKVSRKKSRAASSHEDSEAEPQDATSTAKRDADNHNLHRPVILADDEKAHKILQPSVRSVLSKLETLLINLHHSRRNHWENIHHVSGDEAELATNDIAIEAGSDIEAGNSPQLKRKRGRPPKFVNTVSGEQHVTTDAESETSAGPAKRKKGRPRKYNTERLEGESYYMMIKRYEREKQEREQHERSTTPFETDDADKGENSKHQSPLSAPNSPSKRRRRSSTGSTASGTSARSDRSNTVHLKTLNLRDWSEVLGLAVLSGFKPEVVQRAGQRCANLFGEGMAFATLEERGTKATETVEYRPEAVPALPVFGDDETDEEEETDHLAWDNKSSLTCPYKRCPRSHNAYATRWRLNEHLKRAHGGNGDQNKSVSAADDLLGGLHNDGFLEIIEARAGWGVKRKKRQTKKRKVEEE
ncbi:uncharacterized protein K452DRAFT_288244 [Aplosporella prunicola CBS 121167]|uniref:Rrn9 domain-containing protein n=1 Tax=Aplosporella prunicola CBS 121167 TaxID=1176127 RepID=A0A6A6BBU0_9PEZI|nr:uncharacterized protein K452DRAFT_288244 [Aplosporella prunicola CBS 121167]KAF2140833.1 hypothetical protein K452DRAFT_288244 [Aplosporella prunicola CBS 121167]